MRPGAGGLKQGGPKQAGAHSGWRKDPGRLVRTVLAVLLFANLAAAFLVFRPPGGSSEELEQQLGELRRQMVARREALERVKSLVAKIEKARKEGDGFIAKYFLNRRTAYSTLYSELTRAAQKAGIKPREHSFAAEPVEGSDTLDVLTITANYEGTYADLLEMVNLLDRSERLLIVESLQAAPQQSGGALNVNMRFDTFVREEPQR